MTWLRSVFSRHLFRLVILFASLELVVLVVPIPVPQTPGTRQLTLSATQFEFTPGRIEVSQGDRIVINITASDVVHGFHLDGYGIDTRLEPGITTPITFVADQPGKFRYRCSVSCGSLHPFMIGELVVGPNAPYWRTVGIVLVALAGMLAYHWRFQLETSRGEINQ